MKLDIKDFIAVYEDAYDGRYCDQVVAYYEKMVEAGFGASRQQRERVFKTLKDDTSIYPSMEGMVSLLSTPELSRMFLGPLWDKYLPMYTDEFGVLLSDKLEYHIYEMKIQKTKVGGGYHVWHYENSHQSVLRRVLVYCLYLNDVEEGGETEFLYQGRRIKPKKGTLMIFPAYFTHTHRGNPPISNEKYLLNGWIEL